MRKRPFLSVLALVICVLPVGCSFFRVQRQVKLDSEIEAALLRQDWTTVAVRCGAAEKSSAPLHLVQAHAYLATNRNNESLCQLIAVSPDDLRTWDQYTDGFLRENRKSSSAAYLRGDALARMKRWAEAQGVLTGALKRDPHNAMLLNARGAVLSARQDWDSALLDLEAATKANPRLADAFASLGAVWIKKREAPEGALTAFGEALKISPDYAMALNGKGAAEFASCAWKEAAESLVAARDKAACLTMPTENLTAIAKTMKDLLDGMRDRDLKSKPGMGLRASKWEMTAKIADAMGAINKGAGAVLAGLKFTPLPSYNFAPLGKSLNREGNDWFKLADGSRALARALKDKPGGVQSEDLRHACMDSGRWLVTGYGLGYHVAEVQPPPEVSAGSAK